MSEFKFACPVCGQHITADSQDTGSQISCPTCFRKIVVPQAPSLADLKFVLSASEANKPRPPQPAVPGLEPIERKPEKTAIPVTLIVLLVLACAAGATLFALRGKFHSKPDTEGVTTGDSADTNKAESPVEAGVRPEYVGTNLWTLDLSNVTIPDTPLAGSLHHQAFTLERATLSGSNLTLRIGRSGPVELGLSIAFFNHEAEELSGKAAEVKPTDPKAPRVVLYWKESERQSQPFHDGYAMKVEFGNVSNNSIPGELFICLPDDARSWVAGTFRAEIRKPRRPRGSGQRTPQ